MEPLISGLLEKLGCRVGVMDSALQMFVSVIDAVVLELRSSQVY